MKYVYVVRIGNLYFKESELIPINNYWYKMTDNLDDASFSEDFDYAKKLAEKIGGKVYRINLEEVED